MTHTNTSAAGLAGLRRRQFGLGAAALALLAGPQAANAQNGHEPDGDDGRDSAGSLLVEEMERILQTQSRWEHGVLSFSQDRPDLLPVRYAPLGVTFMEGFQVENELDFQGLATAGPS